MIDVADVVAVAARRCREPRVEDLQELRLRGCREGSVRARSRRSSAARRPRWERLPHSAARIPATLLAAIDAPVPVQQATIAWSARPSATSRAAASLAHAQSGRSRSAYAPWRTGSWPRRRSSSGSASATPVSSSAASAIRTGGRRSDAGGGDRLALVSRLAERRVVVAAARPAATAGRRRACPR